MNGSAYGNEAVVPIAEVAASLPCPCAEAKPLCEELAEAGLVVLSLRGQTDWRNAYVYITDTGLGMLEKQDETQNTGPAENAIDAGQQRQAII